MYHIALELSQEQVKQLKLLATTHDQSVKDFVTGLVIEAIQRPIGTNKSKIKKEVARK